MRRHDAAIVAAHPFRWDQDFRTIAESCCGDFDAIELVSKNVTLQTRAKSESILKTYPAMGRTGSSDGHEQDTIGCYYTEFPGAICTISEFVEALRTRSGQPRACAGKFHAAGEIR